MTNHRHYHFPISQSESISNMRTILGHTLKKDKSLIDVSKSLDKAISNHYYGISLPPNSYKHPQFDDIFHKILQSSIKEIKIYVELTEFLKKEKYFLKLYQDSRISFVFVLNGICQLSEKINPIMLQTHLKETQYIYYYYDLSKYEKALSILYKLNILSLQIYIPEEVKLSTYEAFKIFESAKKLKIEVTPPQLDIFSSLTPDALEIESLAEPLIETSTTQKSILASVIIPYFNNSNDLLQTLSYLDKQSINKENFEIIVVDDGSHNMHKRIVQTHIKKNLTHLNMKYIYFPRVKPRKRGDHQFRAGPARNLGFKFSEGEKVLFLDSDIITPPQYIKASIGLLDIYDVVQHPRYIFRENSLRLPSNNSSTKNYRPEENTNQALNLFWKNFYNSKQDWNSQNDKWRFVSTHTLCLSRTKFIEAGLFKKSFTQYGFEDTDLGFRLYKNKCQFHLSDLNTYHIVPHWSDSDFLNSIKLRQSLLKKSGRLFFKNNLDSRIIKALRGFAFDYFTPKS